MPFDLQSLKKELQPSALKERAQNINDRYSSPSTASTGYGSSGSGSSARPRPSTKLPSSSSTARRQPAASPAASKPPPPLPPHRTVAPGLPRRDNSYSNSQSSSTTTPSSSIDWSHLSPHDKDEFFNLLDGFFSSRQGVASALRVDPHADVVGPPLEPQMGITRADVEGRDDNH
ncbi:hypothetical protein P389DRAFT_8139 [Cystobasidium minutum MCA 4210]|uniref:uncharacterized protein n=1 Tax=Cystobasidium minutum MCA 4210 TaxID=1397322 RepID=UPI0034CE61B0|eukprot:jgi/Rhomi1/8139/CE8138_1240